MKKLTIALVLCLLGVGGYICIKKCNTEKMEAYLMVYHKDGDHGLHMAISHDGYQFTALNDDKPVIAGDTIAMQKGIRDPHILRAPDGTFYMAMTDLHIFGQRMGYRSTQWDRDGVKYGWGNNQGLVLMRSTDLINWTETTATTTGETSSDGKFKIYKATAPVGEDGKVFLKLKVEEKK